MSDIIAATRTYLLTQSGVTDLVGTRIYFDNLPQGATMPAIVLELSDTQYVRKLAATTSLRRSQVVALCFSESRTQATALQAAVAAAVEFDTGTWGSVTVRRAIINDEYHDTVGPGDASDSFRRIGYTLITAWHT